MSGEDLKDYKLFISHINREDEEHDLFIQKLNASYHFRWMDGAVRGKISTDDLLKQMKPVDVVIILSGLCSKDEALITREISTALKLKKPILVIRPYGLENVPSHLEEIADEIVGWNTPCIVDAIEDVSHSIIDQS